MTPENLFLQRVDALGSEPNEKQVRNLVDWVVHHLPRHHWRWAAEQAIELGDFYTHISERMGECGVYY